MTLTIERQVAGGCLDFNGNGVAGCARCGWRGVAPLIAGKRQTTCPACEIEEAHAYVLADTCDDCGAVCIEQSMRDGRRWGDLEQGDLYRPGMAPVIPIARAAKVGRNDPCPCGSGRKHKKCCGAAA